MLFSAFMSHQKYQQTETDTALIMYLFILVTVSLALESTQPLTEMNTRNLPAGKGRPAREAGNLTAICEPIF
jgi:hypothetical protein